MRVEQRPEVGAFIFVSTPDECDSVAALVEDQGWQVVESGIGGLGGEWIKVERIEGTVAMPTISSLIRAAGINGRFAEASKFWRTIS